MNTYKTTKNVAKGQAGSLLEEKPITEHSNISLIDRSIRDHLLAGVRVYCSERVKKVVQDLRHDGFYVARNTRYNFFYVPLSEPMEWR
ncbi:hypothetical protein PilKf_02628 [Pillotina sp. SPG140]